MQIPGLYRYLTSVTHDNTPVQVGQGTDGKLYYNLLLIDPNTEIGTWSESKALRFPTQLRPLGGDISTYTPVFSPSDPPPQVISDGNYLYVFRLSPNKTVYCDRFVIDVVNALLNQPFDVRLRSDNTYGHTDLDGKPYYEPTIELTGISNIANGWFTVIRIPSSRPGMNRWQFFVYEGGNSIRAVSIRCASDGLFDTADIQTAYAPYGNDDKPGPIRPLAVPGVIDFSFGLDCGVCSNLAAARFTEHEAVTDPAHPSKPPQILRTGSHVMLAFRSGKNDSMAVLDFEVGRDGGIAKCPGSFSLPLLTPSNGDMQPIEKDSNALLVYGGLLDFARTPDTPFILDSGDGFVHLFFRDENSRFVSAFYDTMDYRWVTRTSPNAAQVKNMGDWVGEAVKTAVRGSEVLFLGAGRNPSYVVWQYDPLVTGDVNGDRNPFPVFPGESVIPGCWSGVFDSAEGEGFTGVCTLEDRRVLFFQNSGTGHYEVWRYDETTPAGARDGREIAIYPSFPGKKIVEGADGGIFADSLDGASDALVAHLGGNRVLFCKVVSGDFEIWQYDPTVTGSRDGRMAPFPTFPGNLIASGSGLKMFEDDHGAQRAPVTVTPLADSRVLFFAPRGTGRYRVLEYDPTIAGKGLSAFPGSTVVTGEGAGVIDDADSNSLDLTKVGAAAIGPNRVLFYNLNNAGDYQIWDYDPAITGDRNGNRYPPQGFPGTLVVKGDQPRWFFLPFIGPHGEGQPAFVCPLGPIGIQGRPAVLEHGTLQTDANGNFVRDTNGNPQGALYRWYVNITHATAAAATRIIVEPLEVSSAGTCLIEPSLLGYIEGPPPLPRENMVDQAEYNDGGQPGYKGSSVFLTVAEEAQNLWTRDQNAGIDAKMKTSATATLEGCTMGLSATIDTSYGFLDGQQNGSTYDFVTTRSITQEGESANGAWTPYNYGMAYLTGFQANVYALKLKGGERIVGYQQVPSGDQPTVQELRFPLNPSYTKQGTLDGRIGLQNDPDYPNALNTTLGNSYYKPDEARAFEAAIEKEAQRRQAFYGQYNANAFNTLSDDEKAGMTQRSLVTTVQWQAPGGLTVMDDQITTMSQVSAGGSFNFLGMIGYSCEGSGGVPLVGQVTYKLNVMVGGHLNLTVRKSEQTSTTFRMQVFADCDQDVVNAKPGEKVQRYEFKTFYLEQDQNHFVDFFNRVIDTVWLNGQEGEAKDAETFRAVMNRPKPCWRILHRVTGIDRGEGVAKAIPALR